MRKKLVHTVEFEPMPEERFKEELEKKIILPKPILETIGHQAYTIAWTIAATTDRQIIARLREDLIEAIESGDTFETWFDNVSDVFERIGVGDIAPWYAEVIFRTTLGTVFEAVRYERLMNDENVEWLVYDAINDDRVREDHLALDGLAYPRNEFPAHLWPPNGYNCRCTVIPASKDDLASLGAWRPETLAGLPEPDEGFGFPPSFSGLTEAAKNAMLAALDKLINSAQIKEGGLK